MKTPRVFISHSAKQEIGSIRNLLELEKVKSIDSFDAPFSQPIGETIRSAIDDADAVIAIVGSEAESSNVPFEVGYAAALRKPVLLIVKPGRTLPEFVGSLRYLVSDASDSSILRIGVRGFLKDVVGRSRKRKGQRSSRAAGNSDPTAIRDLLNRLVERRSSIEAVEAERIVADLLRAASVTALEEQKGESARRADFAVWSDDLHSSLGNPILVEVKTGNLSEGRLDEAYSQLVRQVSESDARFGLLLYLDRRGRRFQRPGVWVPVVLAFDLEDFANQLLTNSFAKTLFESRNKLVHGML